MHQDQDLVPSTEWTQYSEDICIKIRIWYLVQSVLNTMIIIQHAHTVKNVE